MDREAFRARFKAYKEGKPVSEIYDAGLPKYDIGKVPEVVDDATLDFIIQHEGFKPNTWVKDPVTGKMLLGSGIDVDKYKEQFRSTGRWSSEDNRRAIKEIVVANRPGIRRTFGKAYDKLTPAQKGVLDDIAYNIGVGKLNSKFSPKFVAAVLSGDMEEAKRQMDWGNHQARGLVNRNKDRQAWWDTASTIRPPKYIARPDNYDYETAEALGYQPDETGHWPSRNYVTGEYLKSPSHSTMMKTIVTDIGQGYNTFYNKNTGRIGSQTWMKPLPRPTFDLESGEIKIPFLDSDEEYYFKNGKLPSYSNGKISIKPANRGKLTRLKARTGKSESELYNDGNPAHKKMVVFARNARKWKH